MIYLFGIYNFYDETLIELELYTDCDFPDNQSFRKPRKYLGSLI